MRAVIALVCLALLLPSAAKANTIEEVRSPGGITAWLVHEPAIPIIALKIAFDGGSAYDPQGKEGLANMLSGLLDEGAGELDSLTFQTRLRELAVGLGFEAGRDGFYGSLSTLSRNRDEAFELLRLALNAPRFDAEPLERIRGQLLARLRFDARDPGAIASRTWFAKAFDGHPYASPTRGTPDSIAAITADDLRGYAGKVFARDRLAIGVVGDITAEELAPALDRIFGGLPAEAGVPPVPAATLRAVGAVEVVDFDLPQSRVLFGGAGVARDDPDWYAAYLLNYILGGGTLTSRLGAEVRERRGLAYSINTYLLPLDHAPLHLGGVGTQNARVAETLTVVRSEIARMRREGVGEDELQDAKTYINGSFPLSLTSSGAIAGVLRSMQQNDLGSDYLERRPTLFNAVTPDDIKRVAQRLLDPEAMFVVVVGRPEGVDSGG